MIMIPMVVAGERNAKKKVMINAPAMRAIMATIPQYSLLVRLRMPFFTCFSASSTESLSGFGCPCQTDIRCSNSFIVVVQFCQFLFNPMYFHPQVPLRYARNISYFGVWHFIKHHGYDNSFRFFQPGY